MSFGTSVGIITDGPGADAFRSIVPSRYSLPAGQQIVHGQVFRRNLFSVPGRNDNYPAFSAGDSYVLPTSANSGYIAGVYNGVTIQNTNSVAQSQPFGMRRVGVSSVRAAVLNGGTAISVGTLVGFSAVSGASTYDVATQVGSYIVGASLGLVMGYQINTTTATAVSATGSQTINLTSTIGVTTATPLTLDYGQSTAETVTPTAVTAQVCANGNIVVGGTFSAGTVLTANVNGVSVSYTVVSGDTNLTGAAASFAKAINASAIVNGIGAVVAPAVAVSGTVYFTALAGGTPGNSITLTASAVGGTTTATASGATLASGAYGTITANFQQTHATGAVVLGQQTNVNGVIIPVPSGTGTMNVANVLVDLSGLM